MAETDTNIGSESSLKWDDPINWKELGVFTDESEVKKLLAVIFGSIIFFFILYVLASRAMPQIARQFGGPDNYYGQMK